MAAKGKQPKPKPTKGGPSTMERIAQGGKQVKSIAARNKSRAKAKKGK